MVKIDTDEPILLQRKRAPSLHYSSEVNLKDFTLEKVIGRGKFGKVFLVRKKDNQRIYAMKVIKKVNIKTEREKLNAIVEKAILQKISSPFIVRIHFAFQSPEKLYFVLDYLNGGELFFHLAKNVQFSEKRA